VPRELGFVDRRQGPDDSRFGTAQSILDPVFRWSLFQPETHVRCGAIGLRTDQ
jgi:hypothetical protein